MRKTAAQAVIVAAKRTPIGGFNGKLASIAAPQLGAHAIRAAVAATHLKPADIQQVWMGNVVSANLGQAPARQAALAAGLGEHTVCTTVNKVCSSGLKAAVLAAQQIELSLADAVVAGGFESMSNAPYYLPKARWGMRMGHAQAIDGVIEDGLWDPHGKCHMGSYAELCAEEYAISRAAQDAHADASYARAAAAIASGAFDSEIAPVELPSKRGGPAVVVATDEEASRDDRKPAASARPAFKKGDDATVTAANASTLSDGAAALVLMSRAAAEAANQPILATVRGYADAEQAPAWFTTAPAAAIPKALAHAGVALLDVDYFEINEAFSVVSVANNQLLGLDAERVNVNGGAVALGHPIGASGARIVVTLLSVLAQRGGRIGVAAICNGGGGASALVVEREV